MGIKRIIKSLIIRLIPKGIVNELERPLRMQVDEMKRLDSFTNISFSQEGEDLILYRLMGPKQNGFYVDIGAHHPFLYSNTCKFYLMGWSGVNIDALPGSMTLFKQYRPKDINVEVAISNDERIEHTYYMFEQPALNTLNELNAKKIITQNPDCLLVNKLQLKTKKLANILSELKLENKEIDFFSIDVEGLDLDVLKSNDWDLFRPKYIIVEDIDTEIADNLKSEISLYLKSKGYKITSKAVNSIIYKSVVE